MKKVVLFEEIDFLAYRIEKLLGQYNEISLELLCSAITKKSSLDRLQNNTDLIIIDFDSIDDQIDEVLEILKKNGVTGKTPIIAVSSNTTKEFILKAARYGIDRIISKPFEDVLLLDRVLNFVPPPRFSNETDSRESNLENVSILQWNDYYSIGISEIDAEHKQMIEKFAKLYHLMREGQGHAYYFELLDFLKFYVSSHFEHEEKHQHALGFPHFDEHKKRHQEFREQVENIIAHHSKETATSKDLIKINLFLKNWLMHHILVEDKKIGEYVIKNKNLV